MNPSDHTVGRPRAEIRTPDGRYRSYESHVPVPVLFKHIFLHSDVYAFTNLLPRLTYCKIWTIGKTRMTVFGALGIRESTLYIYCKAFLFNLLNGREDFQER